MKITAKSPVLVCIAGLNGAIGSTLVSGVMAIRNRKTSAIGLVTETQEFKRLNLSLPLVDSFHFLGWDFDSEDLLQTATKQGICPSELICEEELKQIVPRAPFTYSTDIKNWIEQESRFIRDTATRIQADQILIVNVLPTEHYSKQKDDSKVDWTDLNNVGQNQDGVTVSRIYYRLAIEAGAHHLNFTPNIAETPSLCKLATDRQLLYCGRDGKTGQTFLKTVLAPAFRDRHLLIDGWFSTNILGNEDGRTLNDRDAFISKKKSKSESLKAILGYTPGGREDEEFNHQVQINYYPPRSDSKESWDNIDFSGFLENKMQMKVNWLGQDSILAAPLIIDMIRLLVYTHQFRSSGMVSELGYFFKSPLTAENTPIQHSVPAQYDILIRHLRDTIHPKPHANGTDPKYRSGYSSLNYSELVKRAIFLDRTSDKVKAEENASYLYSLIEKQLSTISRGKKPGLQSISDEFQLLEKLLFAGGDKKSSILIVPEESGGNPALVRWAKRQNIETHFIPMSGQWGVPDWARLNSLIEDLGPGWVYFDLPFAAFDLDFSGIEKTSKTQVIVNASYDLKRLLRQEIKPQESVGVDLVVGSTAKAFAGVNLFFAIPTNSSSEKIIEHRFKYGKMENTGLLPLLIDLLDFKGRQNTAIDLSTHQFTEQIAHELEIQGIDTGIQEFNGSKLRALKLHFPGYEGPSYTQLYCPKLVEIQQLPEIEDLLITFPDITDFESHAQLEDFLSEASDQLKRLAFTPSTLQNSAAKINKMDDLPLSNLPTALLDYFEQSPGSV